MKQQNPADPLHPHDGPELVVGIVAPVGARVGLVCDVVRDELAKFTYASEEIRVSTLLHRINKFQDLERKKYPSEYERIKDHMKAGTDLRCRTERGDIFSLLAIGKIRDVRASKQNQSSKVSVTSRAATPLKRTAFILRSLKHPDEITTLRDIYGRAFFVVSAYMPRSNRVDALADVIAKSVNSSDKRAYRDKAEELISIDENEGDSLGQNVGDAFPLADLFVDTRSMENVERSVSRFLELFFGFPFHTPTKDEFSMFHARSAALRSADLSRQVGASIANQDGDVVAVGCNDVPKAGGGQYWAGDSDDDRDFKRGYDSSAKFKREIVAEVLDRLRKGNWLAAKKKRHSVDRLTADLLLGDSRSVLKGTQILSLLEFGRPVHAEMAALMDAARRGVPVQGCTLYSTTFPCHMCARHIIAAGITRVVYIEPYPKSMAGELYGDSIAVDPPGQVRGRVQFESFVGIAPIKYMTLFEMPVERKSREGNAIAWSKNSSNPRLKRFVLSYLLIEENVVGELIPNLLRTKRLEFK